MKHIFIVHSHISFYGAIGVVKHLKIPTADVAIITARNYQNQLLNEFNHWNFSELHDVFNGTSYKNFYRKFGYISQVDRKLETITTGKFALYISHFNNCFFQILATNKNCEEISIIEEGVNHLSKNLFSYNIDSIKKLLKWVFIQKVGKSSLYGKNRFFQILHHLDFELLLKNKSNKKVYIYGFSDNPFPHFISQDKIKIDFVLDSHINFSIPCNSIVFILEGAVEQGNLKLETLLNALKTVAKDNFLNKTVYVKFHPAQISANRNKILDVLTELNTKCFMIPDTVPMEQIFIRSHNLIIHGFTSSLLYYAFISGHDVISHEELLLNDKAFSAFRKLNDFDLKNILK